MAKKPSSYTVREYAKLWVQSAPSADTLARRRSGVTRLVEDFGGRDIDGGVTDPEARSWAPRHPGDVRYAKSLFKAAVDDGVASRDPFRRTKQAKSRRKIVLPPLEKVREAADAALALPVFGREMRALILVAVGSGLRVTELCKLDVRDVIEVPDLRLQVWDGKGHVDRTACVFEPFGGSVVEDALREQMRQPHYTGVSIPKVGRVWLRPPDRQGCVPGVRKESPYLDRHQVGKIWAGDAKNGKPGLRDRVGLGGCRWHDLRHAHATWLLDRGCTAEEAAWQLLGHPDPQLIISTYGHPNAERARERMRAKVANV